MPYADVNSAALWRFNRYGPGEYIKKLKTSGIPLSPLSLSPGMKLDCVCIDVLHAVDLGFALDALGNFFWLLVTMRSGLLSGTTIELRTQDLWNRIQG